MKHWTSNHVAVRLDDAFRLRIEALTRRMSTDWFTATVSDALRACIVKGLPIVEEMYPEHAPPSVPAAPGKSGKRGGRR